MAKQKGIAPRRAIYALLAFYILGGLLNGTHLLRQAELMPFGTTRDIAIILAKPLDRLSTLTRLDTVRSKTEDWLAKAGWNTP